MNIANDPATSTITPTTVSTDNDQTAVSIRIERLWYGSLLAVRDTHLQIQQHTITAFIGPSGCGKSTVLRSINRMNDLIAGCRLEGQVIFQGQEIYAPEIDPTAVRRHIGMVFQQPNPFAMSIFDNVAFGLRLNGVTKRAVLTELVEKALHGANLWDEVKDKIHKNALGLSGGQKQRLCIARAIATEPTVLLMDEPCSALDPISTGKIEELMLELKQRFTVVIVTHNLQQARRVADRTGFMYVDKSQGGRTGYLVEYASTEAMFTKPAHELTQQYLAGQFG